MNLIRLQTESFFRLRVPEPTLPEPNQARRPHRPATIERTGELVTKTTLGYREIARRTGTSPSTVSRAARRRGWLRPETGFPEEHYTENGRRLLRRRALAEVVLRQAERHVFEIEMNPDTRPKPLARAFRLLRLAKAFDELDRPKRKRRRRKPTASP